MSDDTEDFAAMFETSAKAKRIQQGDTIDGIIVAIGREVAFVDVGSKGEATIEIDELKDQDGKLDVAVGDPIHAVVIATAGELRLSRKLARGAATARQVEDAFHTGLPVEGRVEKTVKGGYEVRIAGQRAFCPFSQIDTARGSDPSVHIGKVYVFRITAYTEGGRNIVLSRRALLEDEQRAMADEIRRSIVPGAVLTGRIASVRDFGAFVDLGGGVQGLLHVSEIGWARVSDPSHLLKAGEEITVKVLHVDDSRQKISLGLKQLTEDPWSRVDSEYGVGQVVVGTVTRITEFGAFVELEPGVEALAHASTFAPTGRPQGWKAQVAPGTKASFEVLSVDVEKRRMSVALVPEGSSRAATAAESGTDIVPGRRLKGKVERHEKFGIFVFLAPGRTGLIPMSETGLANESSAANALPIGTEVDVIVLDIDNSGRRITLSMKAIQDAQDAAEVREYKERTAAADAEGFGSLADKLQAALKSRDS